MTEDYQSEIALLRTHSYYSFLRGLASPQELATAAQKLGYTALALTDHHGLSGALEFYTACQHAGLKPILGLELEVTPPTALPSCPAGVLALLAMDETGWSNLCRLASLLPTSGEPLSYERLAEHAGGLICLSGGIRSAVTSLAASGQTRQAGRLLEMLAEIYPDRLYIELQIHQQEDDHQDDRAAEVLSELAERKKLPMAASSAVYYLQPLQAHTQRVAEAIRRNQLLADLKPGDAAPPHAYLPGTQEFTARFSRYLPALEGAQEAAGRCQLRLPLDQPHYPAIFLPAGQTALDVLREKAGDGARRYYPSPIGAALDPAIQARLDHELQVIEQTGYAALFLIMEDILNFARRQGILFTSRGSAASSLVAHCLGITSPDPIALNLYFERFLNPARHTPPDIDTDLCSRRREEVIRYVYQRFGEDRVATVCTVNRMRRRSALRAVAKVYGLAGEEISALAEALPFGWFGPAQRRKADDDPYRALKQRYPEAKYRSIFRDAAALIGLPDHLSVHPGGMVIAPGKLTDLVPLQAAAKGVTITQFDLDSIERLGLIKIDLLGIRGLTVLADCASALQTEPGPANLLSVLDGIPATDEKTSATLEHGQTIGCFQIESPGMRATLREIHARNEADLLAALALYRPGPLTGGLKDAFVRRHRGLEDTTYLHPALEPLLCDTYGVILYQEQVLRIAHEIAGLSLADSDLLRRAMSHFDPGKQMQTLKEKFQHGALRQNNVPLEISEKIWELMAAFAGYGFPKAHAASYAQLGWRLAWSKTHYPAVFMTAVLANWGGYYSQRIYLTEARRLGLNVRPPQVNYARGEFSLSYLEGLPVLFMGLDQVKELSHRTQKRIIDHQPFHSLQDFLARVDPRPIEAENLAKTGALADFGPIPALLRQIELGGWQGGQLSLFPPSGEPGDDWSLAEKVAAQQSLLGASLDAHPLELAAERVAASGAVSSLEAAARVGQRVRLAGVRHTWRRTFNEDGQPVYFMALEDLEGMLDVVIDSSLYRRSRTVLSTIGPYLIEGSMSLDAEYSEPYLRAERIALL